MATASLTPGFLFLSKRASVVLHSSILGKIIGVGSTSTQPIITYKFTTTDELSDNKTQSTHIFNSKDSKSIENIPICSVTPEQQLGYQEKLHDIKVTEDTDAIICFDTVSSTQSIIEKIHAVEEFSELDIIVTSKEQVEGRGRRSLRNWSSPAGCAMASFNHRFRLDSVMGRKLGFVQHLVSLSIVKAIPDIPALKIKWPNDVYYKKSKIAGLIVNCSLSADQRMVSVFIGFGVNVDNDKPTDYLNRILKEDYKSNQRYSTGQVISNVVNIFKNLADSIKTEENFKAVKQDYESKWMHSCQVIEIEGQSWKILGVDDQGFIQVKDINSGVQTTIGMDLEDFSLSVVVDEE
jgi:biotin-[acetyl-CoA-carboxylase] ligase BirA-like protein